jgi:hypothetical protein
MDIGRIIRVCSTLLCLLSPVTLTLILTTTFTDVPREEFPTPEIVKGGVKRENRESTRVEKSVWRGT